jgi:branched-chain amino acid transport system ATP-binding protein
MTIVNPILGTTPLIYVMLTCVLFGLTAFLTGQAVAEKWLSAWALVPAALGLAVGARFLTFALFNSPLLHLPGFLAQFVYLLAVAFVAWRLTLAYRMVAQYPWLYERAGLFSWREKAGAS